MWRWTSRDDVPVEGWCPRGVCEVLSPVTSQEPPDQLHHCHSGEWLALWMWEMYWFVDVWLLL